MKQVGNVDSFYLKGVVYWFSKHININDKRLFANQQSGYGEKRMGTM
jgi:hypothetical protein